MELYKKDIQVYSKFKKHPELKKQAPNPIGILESNVYRFVGTNLFSWYVKTHSCFWNPYGELIYLTDKEIQEFIAEEEK